MDNVDIQHVVSNLHYRYSLMEIKHCYTSCSPNLSVLISINPYQNLPINSDEYIKQFNQAINKGEISNNYPHPFNLCHQAYMRMIKTKCNQSIIPLGESGSGKV